MFQDPILDFQWVFRGTDLILDGFDEMAMKVDKKIRERNFEVLAELAVPPNKTILTGRPGYFPNFKEIKKIFGIEKPPKDKYEAVNQKLKHLAKPKPTFKLIRVNPMSPRQIKRFIDKQWKFHNLGDMRHVWIMQIAG